MPQINGVGLIISCLYDHSLGAADVWLRHGSRPPFVTRRHLRRAHDQPAGFSLAIELLVMMLPPLAGKCCNASWIARIGARTLVSTAPKTCVVASHMRCTSAALATSAWSTIALPPWLVISDTVRPAPSVSEA